jgi:hypothetical protein
MWTRFGNKSLQATLKQHLCRCARGAIWKKIEALDPSARILVPAFFPHRQLSMYVGAILSFPLHTILMFKS